MYKLYDYLPSGNGYKVRLALTQLGQPFELKETDILAGESRTPQFLAINPNGRIPVLALGDGTHLAESHAIIWYLAETHGGLLPPTPRLRAEVMQYLCFEQYNLEPTLAVVRFWLHSKGLDPRELGERLEEKREAGYQALGVLESHLEGKRFALGDTYSLADIGLYAYTHVAHEGGFDLDPYPGIRAWLSQVAAVAGHIPITARP